MSSTFKNIKNRVVGQEDKHVPNQNKILVSIVINLIIIVEKAKGCKQLSTLFPVHV